MLSAMVRTRRYLRRRDALFAVLVAINTLAIGSFIEARRRAADEPPTGWRRIDIEALERRIAEGELMRREAEWYRAVEAAR